jgi:hypothetical protein
MAAVGVSFFQFWAEATGSWIESLTFSMEGLPELDASGVIAMNSMVNQLDPSSLSGPPEAAGFLIGWETANGWVDADPVFWGAFFAQKLRRVDFGVTCIQSAGKWTISVELWQ